MRQLDPTEIDLIVIHTTVSHWGNVAAIDRWHRMRGFDQIGYHFVIYNAFATSLRWKHKRPDPWIDGSLRSGRQLEWQGAHVRGHNDHTLGVALVGVDGQFSGAQVRTTANLCRDLRERYPSINKVVGHSELDTNKTCPDLDMDHFRRLTKDHEMS